MSTWLIIGASRGLGVHIAHHALAAGPNVVATARKAEADTDHAVAALPVYATPLTRACRPPRCWTPPRRFPLLAIPRCLPKAQPATPNGADVVLHVDHIALSSNRSRVTRKDPDIASIGIGR
jgi:NAD(P)-dependent dehydrogenase (short-subunit alcohol dehydrogenase family)